MFHVEALLAVLVAFGGGTKSPGPVMSGHLPSTRVEAGGVEAVVAGGHAVDAPAVGTLTTVWISQFGNHELTTVAKPTDKPGDLAERHLAELREAQKSLAPISPRSAPSGGAGGST